MNKPNGPKQDTNWSDNSGYSHIELYPNGEYKSFIPVSETDWLIGKIIVKLQSETVIKFYENGPVEFCFLAEPAVLNICGVPVVVAEGEVIEFYSNGNFRAFTLGKQKRGFLGMVNTWEYQGKSYKPGSALKFSESGDVKSSG